MPPKYERWGARKVKSDRKGLRASQVVDTIQREAKKAGATLAHDGKGGLDPELALAVFRRDEWTCSVPNCKTAKEELDLDHIAGHEKELAEDDEAAAWLKEQAKKPKSDDMDSLHVLCLRHHDLVHERERALEDGKEPPKMSK